MFRVFRSFALMLAAVMVAAPTLPAAQQEERAVYASVLDKSDVPVTSLDAKDFVVREDGVPREVLRVQPATKPMHIAVLVDTSQAMRPYVNDMRQALRSFFRDMQGSNEIALYEFGDRPTRLVDSRRIRSSWELAWDGCSLGVAAARICSIPLWKSRVIFGRTNAIGR